MKALLVIILVLFGIACISHLTDVFSKSLKVSDIATHITEYSCTAASMLTFWFLYCILLS